jgi:flagellar hook-associated protein 3 FlgL
MQTSESLQNINDQQEQITNLSQQISSGVTLSSASDDPYDWAQVMDVKQSVQEYNSILSGINFGTSWGDNTESAMSQLSSLVSEAHQIAISATSTNETDQGPTLAAQVGTILQQALSLANSQYNGEYIFAGTSTSTAPYSIDESTGVVTGPTDSNPILVKTSTSDGSGYGSTAINLAGDDVFKFTSGGNTLNVLQELWNLQQALQNGDTATISSEITTMNDAYNHIDNESGIYGATQSDLTNQQTAINVILTNEQGTLTKLEGTDIADATTKLAQAQTAYQAALQVTGILNNLNLASLLSSSSSA